MPYYYCDYCGKLIEDEPLVETGEEHYHKVCHDELYGICDEQIKINKLREKSK